MSENEQLFRVVFDGSLTGEYDEATVKKRFGRLFHLNDQRVNSLFSGKNYVIKNNVTESQAMEVMIKVAEAGCESSVQEMPDENEPEHDEKRGSRERRLRLRRPPRAGAIVPDRRLKIRRKNDRKYFVRLKKLILNIPLPFQSYHDIKEDA